MRIAVVYVLWTKYVHAALRGWALAKSLSEAPLVWFMERVAKLMQEETPHDHDQHTVGHTLRQDAGAQTGADQV